MLKNIPRIISPDLMKYMMEMGHSDVMILADANYPAAAHAKRIVRMDAVEIPALLEAVLPFFPLDEFVDGPVCLMKNLPSEPVPDIWTVYGSLLEKHGLSGGLGKIVYLDRLPFYEKSNQAYIVVQTGTTARYANIALQKGVV